MYKKIILFLILAVGLISGVFYSFSDKPERDITFDTRSHFENEENYISYLQNNVEFESVKLEYVKIEHGDNFWRVARDNKVDINTLIGVNIFWEDLNARVSQVVIVPSESGTIEFIDDSRGIKHLAELHGVSVEDIEIQKLPFLYALYSGFLKDKQPLAVFVKDARPRTDNMTAKLAGKFKVRQMFRSPLGGRLSSFFGNRKHPVFSRRKFHNGLDIAAPHGTLIGAAREGVVISSGWNGGYGKAVIIQHDNGYKTMYGHMSSIYAKTGDRVTAGKIIGKVGSTGLSTGPHLHFTLWQNGRLLNPMDVLW